MKLTYKALKAKRPKPCEDQLEVYMANFPDNLEITEADVVKAAELNLNLSWFADNFLSKTAHAALYKDITKARVALSNATDSAWTALCDARIKALWNLIK